MFSELVCAGQLPERWPETLLIDSQNFRVKSGPNTGRGFHVLAAVGRDVGEPGRWGQPPRVWRLQPFAHKDQAAWEAFLGALEGAPRVIITDADNALALALAIRSVFAQATLEHRLCEWHLGRKLRYHLPEELLADPGNGSTSPAGAPKTSDPTTTPKASIRCSSDRKNVSIRIE